MNSSANKSRTLWLDYLRTFITVLVVAHHSSLAYTTFASFDKNAYINSTNPIVDAKRWIGLDIFENFNDIFFMFLMFFISGLFVFKSIESKGTLVFIKDRAMRLFFPFLIIGTIAMLIAYYPSYYVAHNNWNIIDYIIDFFTTEQWPVGPPWFIWVLFTFNILLSGIYVLLRNSLIKLADKFNSLENRPALFFTLFFILMWVLYVPIAYNIGAGTWTGYGPFDFQLSRILAYFGFFIFGVIVGKSDYINRLFSDKSRIIKQWKYWMLFSILLYTAITINNESAFLYTLVTTNKVSEFSAWMIYYSFYVACCVTSCIAFISIFRLFIKKSNSSWDSLSSNAYLIYLIHYIFIVWGQFLLLEVNLHAAIKFLLVFSFSLFASWVISIALRRVNFIKKYL